MSIYHYKEGFAMTQDIMTDAKVAAVDMIDEESCKMM